MMKLVVLRILLLSFLLSIFMLFFSFKPIWLDIKREKAAINIFSQQLHVVSLANKKFYQPNKTIDFLVNIAQQNHIVVHVINAAEDNQIIHLMATGVFVDFTRFLAALNQADNTIILADFNWHVDKNSMISVSADFAFSESGSGELSLDGLQINRNPFVIKNREAALSLPDQEWTQASLDHMSVQQLRFAGSLLGEGKRKVILGDSTGRIWMAESGMKVGREHAKILDFDSEGVTLQLANKQLKLKA